MYVHSYTHINSYSYVVTPTPFSPTNANAILLSETRAPAYLLLAVAVGASHIAAASCRRYFCWGALSRAHTVGRTFDGRGMGEMYIQNVLKYLGQMIPTNVSQCQPQACSTCQLHSLAPWQTATSIAHRAQVRTAEGMSVYVSIAPLIYKCSDPIVAFMQQTRERSSQVGCTPYQNLPSALC